MKNLVLAMTLGFVAISAGSVHADGGLFARKHSRPTIGEQWAQTHASSRPWHGNYYYLPYGQPVAMVVPPNAIMQQTYSWGVSQNLMMPTYHQFMPAAVPSAGGAGFYGTPRWPSSTNQFGVYNVRSPW